MATSYSEGLERLEREIKKITEKELPECEEELKKAKQILGNSHGKVGKEIISCQMKLEYYEVRKKYLVDLMNSYKREVTEIAQTAEAIFKQYFSK